MRLKGKVAIITGGGSGIGRASCLAFAREGAKVLIADWSESGGRETEQLVRAAGGEATFHKADISEPADVEGMVAAAVATYGGLHAIYNNAAIVRGYGGPVEAEIDDWDETMAVNVRGTYLCCKFAVPAIIASGGGVVINQSSVAALQGAGPPMSGPCAAYTTSKNAIIGLTRSVAYSYGHKGVRANSIIPGLIATGMTASLLESPEFEQAMLDSTPLQAHRTARRRRDGGRLPRLGRGVLHVGERDPDRRWLLDQPGYRVPRATHLRGPRRRAERGLSGRDQWSGGRRGRTPGRPNRPIPHAARGASSSGCGYHATSAGSGP